MPKKLQELLKNFDASEQKFFAGSFTASPGKGFILSDSWPGTRDEAHWQKIDQLLAKYEISTLPIIINLDTSFYFKRFIQYPWIAKNISVFEGCWDDVFLSSDENKETEQIFHSWFSKANNLGGLSFSFCWYGSNDQISALAHALVNKQIREFGIGGGNFGEEAMIVFSQVLPRISRYIALQFKGIKVGEIGMAALATALRQGSYARQLDINSNRFAFTPETDLLANENLLGLTWGDNSPNEKFGQALAASLAKNKTLLRMTLDNASCAEVSAVSKGLLIHPTLTSLDITYRYYDYLKDEKKSSSGLALAELIATNKVITTLHLVAPSEVIHKLSKVMHRNSTLTQLFLYMQSSYDFKLLLSTLAQALKNNALLRLSHLKLSFDEVIKFDSTLTKTLASMLKTVRHYFVLELCGRELVFDEAACEIMSDVIKANPHLIIKIQHGVFLAPKYTRDIQIVSEFRTAKKIRQELAYMKIAPLIAFVRANKDHPLRYSVLPIIPGIVEMTDQENMALEREEKVARLPLLPTPTPSSSRCLLM